MAATHHGADGSVHSGPGGLFRCEQCEQLQQLAATRAADGHHLSRAQIENHGRDRYPATEKQLRKVGEELIELAMAIGEGSEILIRREYADVGLALYALGDKLGLDLIGCMRWLVEGDDRDFRQEVPGGIVG